MWWRKKRELVTSAPLDDLPTHPSEMATRAEFCDICGDIADTFRRCERHAGWVFKAAGGKMEQR